MNDYEMLDALSPSSSFKAADSISASNTEDGEDINDESEETDSDCSLWSIDDTMFFAKGLMNHSAGKGKSVFVTWNENYLLNFVFKTSSKTKKITLTKVRLMMPMSPGDGEEQEPEEILNMLILEMNTLLLMKSGRVYYFSSVKSIHNVPWLSDVRCFCSCPQTQFSVIRLLKNTEQQPQKQTKQLLLEVYQDVPQLGKCPNVKEVLRHRYDISFDVQNHFNCDWICDRYILISLITDEENIVFLRQLVAIGNCIRTNEEKIKLELCQEVHVFTISGNIFVLIGAIISENESISSNADVQDYTIQLLNTYATTIEFIHIDYKKNLLIVLLQSGHMDIWYRNVKTFGSIRHLSHEIAYFTHYDYNPSENTFYLTKPEEVTQLRINPDEAGEKECTITEIHKAVGGMIACTWVKTLQQLICLSLNNIFYRLCFEDTATSASKDNSKETDVEYENFNTLYALTSKKLKELLSRAQIVNDLMEQPRKLHAAVEVEWQKQQLISLGFKKVWKKVFKCHIEYSMEPTIQCIPEEDLVIRTSFGRHGTGDNEECSMYSLIYLKLTSKDSIFLSIIQTATWQLQISVEGESLMLQVPCDMIKKRLCFIIKYSMKSRTMLPDFSVNLLTFVKHCSVYICINNPIDFIKNEKTYRHLFSSDVQISLFRRNRWDIDKVLQEVSRSQLRGSPEKIVTTSPTQIRQVFENITKQEFVNILELFHKKYENILNTELKLYYLREHEVYLNYEEQHQQLIITTQQPEALLYFKVLLMYEFRFSRSIDLSDSTSLLQKMMQYQSEIEHLYGSIESSEYMDDGSGGGGSLHLENLLKVYSKIRCEFGEIFR